MAGNKASWSELKKGNGWDWISPREMGGEAQATHAEYLQWYNNPTMTTTILLFIKMSAVTFFYIIPPRLLLSTLSPGAKRHIL